MKRIICLLLAVLLTAGLYTAYGEDFPELNENGFLDSGEFLYMGDDEGIWRYASSTLWVEITRKTQTKPAQVWYEAEIRCSEDGDHPHMIPNDPEKWLSSKSADYPYKIARKNRTVIAVSSDYAHLRLAQHARAGYLLRGGEIFSDRTWKQGAKKFPNLDCLAIWPDGDMKVSNSSEVSVREYAEAGATDVLAFGPVLIRDGELNKKAINKYGRSSAQRVAVGMAEKGHYWFMMLEGRIQRSKGAGIGFLAERLAEKDCSLAINLDGGQTACIVFMGHQLCKMDNKKHNLSSRRTADLLGVGISELTASVDDGW